MKKLRKLLPVLALCLLMTFMLAGCSDDTEEETAESTEGETVTLWVKNLSGTDLTEIYVEPVDGSYEAVEITEGEGLGDQYVLYYYLPVAEGTYRMTLYAGDDVLYADEMAAAEWDFNTYTVFIIPSEYLDGYMSYVGDFDDLEYAESCVNEELAGEAPAATAAPTPDPEQQQEIADALAEMGYGSLEEYREEEHYYLDPVYYPDNYYEYLIGYWYPDGDRNSPECFSINDSGEVSLWKFENGKDKQTLYTKVKSMKKGIITFETGETYEYNDSLFADGTLTDQSTGVTYERFTQ